MIIDIEVEPASESDANAFIPIMASIQERDLCPKEIQADSLYESDENHQAAQSDGIDLVAPTMGTTSKNNFSLSDFNLADDGYIIECPRVTHLPIKQGRMIRRERVHSSFSS